jgi:hypothetical protein
MAISNLLTGRVRVVSPKNVTQDRYQFLDVSQAEPNLGVPDFSASLLTNPAIVVSDDQGNRGFVRSLDLDRVTGQFTGSFSGSYIGDGEGLFNLPAATKIASGSATASFVEGNLLVNTNARIQGDLYVDDTIYAESLIVSYISSSVIYSSGSNIFGDNYDDRQEFTGSVLVSSSIIVNDITASQSISSSFTGSFFGDGRDIFNLPQATRLVTGSVTASVTPEDGFNVVSVDNGSTFTGSLFVSGNITIPSGSGFFSGSGEGLFNIPLSALNIESLVASRIGSGSVTASVSPTEGFKVESLESGSQFTGSLFVSGNVEIPSGSGFFSGSGEGLFNIPLSALNIDSLISTTLASGSVTASVSPNFGFKVQSEESGSQLTGSVSISGSLFVSPFSGSIQLASGSSYYGEGQFLRNIPRSALTEDALISTEIKSGSVTASVSPDFGFVVQSVESGSQFTGSISVSGSITSFTFIGDGSQLTNVQAQAAARIESGSVTASVSPNFGFRVESLESGSQFTGSIQISGSVFIPSGSGFFSGSGAGLFDIPFTSFTGDAFRIASGSVTASVAPEFGF